MLAKLLRLTGPRFDRTRRDFLAVGAGGAASLFLPKASGPRIARGPRVAVVGAGFAGLSCAHILASRGFDVHVFEGRNRLGGRVVTIRQPGGPGLAEGGGEFIGTRHAVWQGYVQAFGLELEPVQESEAVPGPYLVDGVALSAKEATAVGEECANLCAQLNQLAAGVNAWRAWDSPDARRLDHTSVLDWLQAQGASRLALRVLGGSLESSNAVPLARQSLLAQLVQVKGGEYDAYWGATRDTRCKGGNATLAYRLAEGIGDQRIRLGTRVAGIEPRGDRLRLREAGGGTDDFDFVVLAVPPSVWCNIALGALAPRCGVQMGTAVKNIAWLDGPKKLHARVRGAEVTTSIWPATPVGSVAPLIQFSGGPAAARASALSPDARRSAYVRDLARSYADTGGESTPATFVDWLQDDFVRGSYSFPAPGQITGCGALWEEGVGRLQFAGEHTCYPFVGYMEGALRSGLRAAQNILLSAR